MLKSQLKQPQIPKKVCFGTKEFSQNSGICNRCNYRDECGKGKIDVVKVGKKGK